MIWTVDAWVLVRANEDLEMSAESQDFLSHLLAGDLMAVNEEAMRAYQKRALKDKYSFSSIWFGKLCLLERVDHHFEPEHEDARKLRRRLRQQLPANIRRFDPDDVPFVVLCFRTDDRHLISGDVGEGDFSPTLTRWLRKEYEICFHELAEARPYHRPRHKCTMRTDR